MIFSVRASNVAGKKLSDFQLPLGHFATASNGNRRVLDVKIAILLHAVALIAAFLHSGQAQAQSISKGSLVVRFLETTTGLAANGQFSPTDFAPLNDGTGRNVVSTFGGKIRLLDSAGTLLDTAATPYASAPMFLSGNGFGGTSVAVHPNFASNGKIYQLVTEQSAGSPAPDMPSSAGNDSYHSVIVEWTANAPASNAPTFTRRDLLRLGHPAEDHGIYELAFGSDGMLYIASGDGGFAGNNTQRGRRSQDLSDHHGMMLRIDPVNVSGPGLITSANGQYGIPTGNMGVSVGGSALDEVFAFGFRSPYRFTFDRANGNIYLGDVGESSREEIDRVVAGANYGWGRFEGTNTFNSNVLLSSANPDHTPPTFQYGRTDGETVVGGFVYRGTEIAALQGKYIFADFGRQVTSQQAASPARLFYGDLNASGDITAVHELRIDVTGEQISSSVNGTLKSRQFIFSFGEDADGELVLVVGDDPQFPRAINVDGRILRLAAAIANDVAGDVNQDGIVSGDGLGLPQNDDVAAFLAGWKTTGHASLPEAYMHGDLNLDGITDLADWGILRENHPNGHSLNLATLLVPEPAAWLAALALAPALRLGTSLRQSRRQEAPIR